MYVILSFTYMITIYHLNTHKCVSFHPSSTAAYEKKKRLFFRGFTMFHSSSKPEKCLGPHGLNQVFYDDD